MDQFKTTVEIVVSGHLVAELDLRVTACVYRPHQPELALAVLGRTGPDWVELPHEHPLYPLILREVDEKCADEMQEAQHAANLDRAWQERTQQEQ